MSFPEYSDDLMSTAMMNALKQLGSLSSQSKRILCSNWMTSATATHTQHQQGQAKTARQDGTGQTEDCIQEENEVEVQKFIIMAVSYINLHSGYERIHHNIEHKLSPTPKI